MLDNHSEIKEKIAQQSGQPDRGKLGGAARVSHWRGQVTRGVMPTNPAPMTIIHLGGEITPGAEIGMFTFLNDRCANGEKEIVVTINSLGGCPQTAATMFNLLRGFPLRVTTHVIGACESAAVLVFLAGHVRRISPGMSLMIHGPRRKHDSITLEVSKQIVKALECDTEVMVTVLSNGLGVPRDEVAKYLSAEYRLTASEAVTTKFATEIAEFHHERPFAP